MKGMLNIKFLGEISCHGHWLRIRKQTLTDKLCVVQMYFYKCMFGAIWWLQALELKDLNQYLDAWCMDWNSCHNITWIGWWDNEGVWKHTTQVCKTYIIGKTLRPWNLMGKYNSAVYCAVFVAPTWKKGVSLCLPPHSSWGRVGRKRTCRIRVRQRVAICREAPTRICRQPSPGTTQAIMERGGKGGVVLFYSSQNVRLNSVNSAVRFS